ncbi:transcriptional regulator with XRE-family HTH domain [Lipingzhangella halophila]|uniref:Transcriptional regulator with XRE-family HTH domain n=1 Tax=Lipingzhangella halophila TaxID=1783352 RepID=A0A7W7RDK2_9ACTN|nr:helix-turn-helix transcriptional regulator [Lipingzhangella halophila]MBB4930010.1 transcriptional regulator with XRE-family HTH domain [Lipingzhangella halophila]
MSQDPQEQHSPIASRLWLGTMLRDLREEAGLTGAQVARELGVHPPRVSNIEKGKSIPSKIELAKLAELFSVPEDLTDGLRELASNARRKSWTTTYEDVLPEKYEKYVGLEEVAVSLKDWHTHMICGLLQTAEHAHALFAELNPHAAEHDRERLVELRLRRQQVLDRTPEPLQLWSIMEEHVLRRPVGGHEVHHAQLQHLLDMQKRPHVTIQIIPTSFGAHTGLDGPFSLLEIGPSYPPIVYIETRGGNLYKEGIREISLHKSTYDQLQGAALPPVESTKLIETIMKEAA